MASTSDIGGLLQRYYTKGVAQTFSDEFWADQEIQKAKNLRWDGEEVKINIHTGRNFGAGAIAESGTLPTPGFQNTQQGTISRRFVYGRIRLTGPAIWAAQSQAHAFKASLDFEMERMVKDIVATRSFHLYTGPVENNTGGLNGIKAKVSAVANLGGAPASFRLTLVDPGGYTSTGAGALTPNVGATRYIRLGEPLVWGTLANLAGTAIGAGTVTAIDRSGQTVTVTQLATGGGAAPLNTHFVARGWGLNIHEANKTPVGLGVLTQHAAGDTFQGIGFDSENWAALNFANGGAAFNEQNLHRQLQVIREVSGCSVNLMVAHPSMSREYIEDLQKDVRFEPKNLKGGYEVLTFSSGRKIKWVFDNDCPYGCVFFLTTDKMMWAVNRPWMWDDTDGAVLRSTDDVDEFTARYVSYYDMGFTQLNCHGVLTGITGVSGTFF